MRVLTFYIAHHSREQEAMLTLYALVYIVRCDRTDEVFEALPWKILLSVNLTQHESAPMLVSLSIKYLFCIVQYTTFRRMAAQNHHIF